MTTIVLAFHLMLAIALIGVVLLQKNEGGLGGMGGGGGMSGFMTGRSTANLLTRATAILAALFFLTSIALAMLANNRHGPQSIMNLAPQGAPPPATPNTPKPSAPAPATPAAPSKPAAPAIPAAPSAPLAK